MPSKDDLFLTLPLLWADLTVIDMMVDPDGTLDALSNLGVTSPLADQKVTPGPQQGAEVSTGSTPSRPEGQAAEARGAPGNSDVPERDPGLQQGSRSHN